MRMEPSELAKAMVAVAVLRESESWRTGVEPSNAAATAFSAIHVLAAEMSATDQRAAKNWQTLQQGPGDPDSRVLAALERHFCRLITAEPAYELDLIRLLAEAGTITRDDEALRITLYPPVADGAAPNPLITIEFPLPSKLPRNIAPPPDSYVGRSDDIEFAVQELKSNPHEVQILVIGGRRGIGRTAFARVVADRLDLTRTPVAQLAVRLTHPDPYMPNKDVPRSPADALMELLVQLGVRADRIPYSLSRRRRLYLDKLASERPLILLEDASDEIHISALLPELAGAVIVTGEAELGIKEVPATLIRLDPLTPRESFELLARHLGGALDDTNSRDAHLIAKLCGHLPLALDLTARRLALLPDLRLGAAAAELITAGQRQSREAPEMQPVAATFQLTYDMLNQAQRYVLHLAALLRGDSFTVSAVCGALPADQVATVVGQLVQLGILETVGTSGDHWRVHPVLIRLAWDLAFKTLRDGEPDVIDYVLRLYVRRASRLSDLLDSPVIKLYPDLLRVLQRQVEEQRAATMAAIRMAVAFPFIRAARLLAAAAIRLLGIIGESHGTASSLQSVRKIAQSAQDPALEARALAHMARQALGREHTKQAAALLHQAWGKAREGADAQLCGDIERDLSQIHRRADRVHLDDQVDHPGDIRARRTWPRTSGDPRLDDRASEQGETRTAPTDDRVRRGSDADPDPAQPEHFDRHDPDPDEPGSTPPDRPHSPAADSEPAPDRNADHGQAPSSDAASTAPSLADAAKAIAAARGDDSAVPPESTFGGRGRAW
ncbi:hypothetical protein [Nonomuraea zeae]|uniref:NB-ARC domain-containing protein n=1 Tax=Nonomuraea zeae TaxID=1642303 RepID=A0A5S4FSA4_9ACTN|nr:hypothetical protein [Nonomuraea zeae]TMR23626.1 hypothetical protein ETD85_47615 [Nonomuraea zeae]